MNYFYTLNRDGVGDNYDSLSEALQAVAESNEPMEIYERRFNNLALNKAQDIMVMSNNMKCQDKNCPHGHCLDCGSCDLLDNDGEGFENDSNPFFCGVCGRSIPAIGDWESVRRKMMK